MWTRRPANPTAAAPRSGPAINLAAVLQGLSLEHGLHVTLRRTLARTLRAAPHG
jgi:hypothetical protein